MEYTSNISIVFLLLLSALYDIRSNKIPNYLTYPGMLFGILVNIASTGFDGFLYSCSGIAAGIGLLILFYLIGGMGAGDVKLLGVVGSFLGVKGAFGSFLYSGIVGGLYSIILLTIYRKKYTGMFNNLYYSGVHVIMTRRLLDFGTIHTDDRPKLCYGVAISAGTGIYLFIKIYGIETFFI